MARTKRSYGDVMRLLADRGIERQEREDGSVYLCRGDLEMPLPSGIPFERWVEFAVEFFELDETYDLLGDPKAED